MSEAPVKTALMTLEEFIHLYDVEGPFELIEGERVNLMPTVARHKVTTRTLYFALHQYVKAHQLGEVFSEAPFVLVDAPNWVKGSRVPDVMFFAANRFSAYQTAMPDWEDKPFVLIPDLAVEVVSQNDTYAEIHRKVTGYLGDGVRCVWVIDPYNQTVTIHTPEQLESLTFKDQLTGSTILEGFEMAVREVFAS